MARESSMSVAFWITGRSLSLPITIPTFFMFLPPDEKIRAHLLLKTAMRPDGRLSGGSVSTVVLHNYPSVYGTPLNFIKPLYVVYHPLFFKSRTTTYIKIKFAFYTIITLILSTLLTNNIVNFNRGKNNHRQVFFLPVKMPLISQVFL